jgi:hypothetical protein
LLKGHLLFKDAVHNQAVSCLPLLSSLLGFSITFCSLLFVYRLFNLDFSPTVISLQSLSLSGALYLGG